MKKLLALGAIASALAVLTPSAHAATATGTFDVLITLTPKCEINSTATATGAVINNISLTYTSFQTAQASAFTDFNVRCTNTLDYALTLDIPTATDYTDALVGLDYQLAFTAGSGGNGTGANIQHTVTGTIAGGQSGTCAGPAPATCSNTGVGSNNTRTLTVTY